MAANLEKIHPPLDSEMVSTDPMSFPFNDVLICDRSEKFVGVCRRLYVEMLFPDSKWFTAVPMAKWPHYDQYNCNGYLLIFQYPSSSSTLIQTIEIWSKFLSSLHHECYLMSCMEQMTKPIRGMFQTRLRSFLELIRVNNWEGPGPIWNPEVYDEESAPLDSVGAQIQAHIQAQVLPMTQLNPVPLKDTQILPKILDFLTPFESQALVELVEQTHFVTALKGSPYLTDRGLTTLMADEFRCVKNGAPIDLTYPFIFDDTVLDLMAVTLPTEIAYQNLKAYVGTYLDELDLSQSFITGSAITATLFRTSIDSYYKDRADQIAILFPILLTSFQEEDQERLRRDDLTTWKIEILDAQRGTLTKEDHIIPFKVRPGSDIDLAVDISGAEFEKVARQHFETIRKHYPFVKLKTTIKANGTFNYLIYTDDPIHLPTFRPVEIYQSSFRNICTHHVGAVRGAYTSRWGSKPGFYLTASGVWTSKHLKTPNYHYFAGRKSSPQEIILKNRLRGIGIEDPVLNQIFETYREQNGIKISPLPFYGGKNVPSSIFGARIERPYFVRNVANLRDKIETLRTNLKLKHAQNKADLLETLTVVLCDADDAPGIRKQFQVQLEHEHIEELAQLDRQEAILNRFV